MCPLWPLHLVVMYLCLIASTWVLCLGAVSGEGGKLKLTFDPASVGPLDEKSVQTVEVSVGGLTTDKDVQYLELVPDDPGIVEVTGNQKIYLDTSVANVTEMFNVTGRFLGRTRVQARIVGSDGKVRQTEQLKVVVVRKSRTLDKMFAYSVAILVSVAYINMGATMDLEVVKQTIKRPIGPVVGLLSQYIFMPLCSFALGQVLFTTTHARLGLFVTGCSPGGGGSNMWTYLLNGNLDLSITMTFFSTVAAFALLPAWVFTLGQVVTEDSLIIPYSKIFTFVIALIIPCSIGLLLQRYTPRCAKVLRRMLGPMAIIIFIMTFGIYANLYIFKMFTWQVVVVGIALPYAGFLMGGVTAKISRLSSEDIIAVAIETGIQNTGVAIFILKFSLPQPEADLTAVYPVAVATMTPFPLILAYIIQRLRKRFCPSQVSKYEMNGVAIGDSTHKLALTEPDTPGPELRPLNGAKPIV